MRDHGFKSPLEIRERNDRWLGIISVAPVDDTVQRANVGETRSFNSPTSSKRSDDFERGRGGTPSKLYALSPILELWYRSLEIIWKLFSRENLFILVYFIAQIIVQLTKFREHFKYFEYEAR